MATMLKKLPIGKQSFENLITSNSLYVDKTEYLYKLIVEEGRYFLSRPRRFGKSLTCSTLRAIFEGRRELFKGLAIDKEPYEWKKHGVVYFDFNGISHKTLPELDEGLDSSIRQIAAEHNIVLTEKHLKEKLKELVKQLHKKYGAVAVIVDEYDKPILDHLKDSQMVEKMREKLCELYGTFKDASIDACANFIFITGVSKFSKVSLFSEPNNLDDITHTSFAATIVGYTQQEVEYFFKDYIEVLATHEGVDIEQIKKKLKDWYNGYRFEKTSETLYNPFSLHKCLRHKEFTNAWFSSGTPKFFLNALEKHADRALALIEEINKGILKIASGALDAFQLEAYADSLKALFLQTGYVTFADYNPNTGNYGLDFPNLEVRQSCTEQLLDHIAHLEIDKFSDVAYRFKQALAVDDMKEFCACIEDFFKLLPYDIRLPAEEYYRSLFFMAMKLINATVRAEEVTRLGRSDVVIQRPQTIVSNKRVYVLEFKYNKTVQEALDQIEEKKYYEAYAVAGYQKITCIGINYKAEGRVIETAVVVKK